MVLNLDLDLDLDSDLVEDQVQDEVHVHDQVHVHAEVGSRPNVTFTGAHPLSPRPPTPIGRAGARETSGAYGPMVRAVARRRLMLRAPFSPRYRRKAAASRRIEWMAASTISS